MAFQPIDWGESDGRKVPYFLTEVQTCSAPVFADYKRKVQMTYRIQICTAVAGLSVRQIMTNQFLLGYHTT